jgi:hypothetical protein
VPNPQSDADAVRPTMFGDKATIFLRGAIADPTITRCRDGLIFNNEFNGGEEMPA